MNTSDTYNQDLQKFLLAYLISDYDIFKKCKPVISQYLFDDQLRRAVRFILGYEAEFHSLPCPTLIQAKTNGTDIKTLADLNISPDMNAEWFLVEFEKFARHRSIENTILEGYDLLLSGRYQDVQDQINAAMKISISDRKHKFDRTPLLDMLAEPQPNWLIKGLCYEKSVGVIFGESETFKSFIVLDLCYRLVHGMEWNGRILKPRNAIIVAGEGANMLPLRQVAWLKHHDLPVKNDGLSIVRCAINLLDPHEVADFLIRMKEYDTDDALLALDTLSTMIAGQDENTAEVMSKVVEVGKHIARELNCAVLLVHHTGKDADRGARGNYALHANVDFEWQAVRIGDMMTRLQVTKQKDGAKPKFFFKAHKVMLGILDNEGFERDSLAVVPTDEIAVECNAPGKTVSLEEADRSSMAAVMVMGQTLSRSQLAELMTKSFGIGKRACENRIDAALPLDEPVQTRRHDEAVMLLRTTATKGYSIKMMVKPDHEVAKSGCTEITDID